MKEHLRATKQQQRIFKRLKKKFGAVAAHAILAAGTAGRLDDCPDGENFGFCTSVLIKKQ